MITDIKITAIIEKRQWVPPRVRMQRRLARCKRIFSLGFERMLRLQPALGALASSVSNLPGGGGPAIQAEQKFLHIIGTFTLSGSYPGAPGDTFDVTLATLPPGYTLTSLGTIIMGWAQSIKSTGPTGFIYTIVPGTTIRNGTLDIQQNGAGNAPNAEIASSGYSGTITGDTVQFEILVSIAG